MPGSTVDRRPPSGPGAHAGPAVSARAGAGAPQVGGPGEGRATSTSPSSSREPPPDLYGARPSGAPPLEIPRVHLVGGDLPSRSGLGAWIAANPVAAGSAVAVLGAMSMANTALGATLETTAPDLETQAARARDRSIVYLGMNEGAAHEVSSLRAALGSSAAVTFLSASSKADVVRLGNVEYDLTTPAGRDGYVQKLGLSGDRAVALAKILEEGGDNARDELAQLARTFVEAESGHRFIERIVLSGHSVGYGVWGDGNGTVTLGDLAKLTTLFPRAAAQVQDLLMAACYSGGEDAMDKYRAMFPNLKTIWAYDGSAPGSASGAVPHITRWERGTRGPSTDNLRRESATHTRKGENVAVWTATRGYANGQPPREIAEVRAEYEASRAVVAEFQSGAQVVTNPGEGPLRDHYNHIQRLLSRRDVPADERAALTAERDVVIRLIYYKNVSTMFQATHKATIQAGFAELGLPAPDFAKLSRKEALEVIAAFDAALAGKEQPSRALTFLGQILHQGLSDLKPAYIPDGWV